MHHFETVDDLIAVDRWRCRRRGKEFTVRIEVGRPRLAPDDQNGDWCCPIFIEGDTKRVLTAMGVGPVDALMNAMRYIRGFTERVDEWAPRADDHPA